jgi:hypothetical protein
VTVLSLIGARFMAPEVSRQLGIRQDGREPIRRRIFGTLGVQNQAHAISLAMRRGWMRPEQLVGLAAAE